jgi:prepilin-type N-terminal cleavage/methylation domain-containing protein
VRHRSSSPEGCSALARAVGEIKRVIGRVRASGEEGFTLVELLVASALMGAIAAAVLTSLANVQRQSAADVERAQQIQSAQTGLYRMTRELREAYRVVTRQPDLIEADVRRQGANIRVRYSCTTPDPRRAGMFRCVREVPANGSAEVVIDHVINGPTAAAADRVFTYSGSNYVRARVWVSAGGEKVRIGHNYRIVLDDGFYMRNCDAGCA